MKDVHYYFKHAVRTDGFKQLQVNLGLEPHVFLRHVSNRWLTLQESLNCVDEPLAPLKSFSKESDPKMQRSDAQSQHRRLALAFSDKALLAKMLFLKKAADLLVAFQNLFKREKPLLHVMHSELLNLVWWVLSRVLRLEDVGP